MWGFLFLFATSNIQWDGQKISHNSSEWLKILGRERYQVMRQKETEKAFMGKYVFEEGSGIYHCAACDLPLFNSKEKYKEKIGWPNFHAPIVAKNIYYLEDYRTGFKRYEVLCRCCDSHLGHVFREESSSNLRYCINSIALLLRN